MADEKTTSGSGPLSSLEAPVMGILSKVPIKQVSTWGKAYFHPMETFEANKKDANFGAIAVNLILIGVIMWATFVLTSLISGGLSLSTGIAIVISLVMYPVLIVIGMFIGSGITFVLAKIFGGKGGFMEQTLALTLIYGGCIALAFPFQVLSAIPLIGLIFGLVVFAITLYNIYNQYLVLKGVHSLTNWKAIAVIAIPIIIAIIIAVIFAAIFAAVLMGMMGGAAMERGAFPGAY
jgi:hypothetical protein